MNITSTYQKNFFLAGRSFSNSNNVVDISSLKKFCLTREEISTTETCCKRKNFNLTKNVVWICPKCGHTHVGAVPTSACPVCNSNYEETK